VKRIVPLTVISLAVALAVAAAALGATILSDPTSRTSLAYAKKALKATAGSVTIRSKNMSPVLMHNIALRKGVGAKGKLLVKGKIVGKGGVSKITLKVAKGKYRFFCTVPGHEAGGMWGILTVK
jgi:uncharacterized cupredoxin-like copper-binding protein